MNRVSELRKKAGLTQRKLGELMQVSQQTVSKYESADANIPSDILAWMAKFFDVSIEYILREDEQEKSPKCNEREELMNIYRGLDQYNKNTWIILGKRLLESQKKNSDI